MAIQNRRGDYNAFDTSKMVAGEWAFVLSNDEHASDGKSVYAAFGASDVKRMATYEDMEDQVAEAMEAVSVPRGGTPGQMLIKNSDTDYDLSWGSLTTGVITFNGRSGNVSPANGDYAASQISYGETNVGTTLDGVNDSIERLNQLVYSNAGAHNSIFRGKNLGSSVTAAQWQAISSGTFDGLFIGDYWRINNINWRIAAFDYWLDSGDTRCTTHHAVIVPDTVLYTAPMNSTNTTAGGYVGTQMRASGLNQAVSAVSSAFGASHILTHRELLTNAISDGAASDWAWHSSQIEILSENMVYGHFAWAAHHGYETGTDKTQLALFQMRPDIITVRTWYWLRNIFSTSSFCMINSDGEARVNSASGSLGVRPVFAIRG